MSEVQATTENQWFYEENGQRKGPVSEREMIKLIKSSVVFHDTAIWKQGFPDWLKVQNTELRVHLDNSAPPPLSGEHINNTFVWVLAFAPIIGYILEWTVAGAMYGDGFWGAIAVELAMANRKYWFITLGLNIALAFFDERRLREAGHDTDKFKGWVWLVPVYLYQRAKATKQNLAYFIVWIVCFVLVLFS
jgi:hypothetical protein